MMSWTVWYIQAILQMARAEAKDLLSRLLSEPEYEMDAAWGLFQMARTEKPSPVVWPRDWPMRRKDFSLIWKARDGQPEVEFVEPLRSEVVTLVKNHVETLVAERAASEHPSQYDHRLKPLAVALAELDGKASADLVLDILNIPETGKWFYGAWTCIHGLEALLMQSVVLPSAKIWEIAEALIQHARSQRRNNQELALMTHLAGIVLFTDDACRSIARIRVLRENLLSVDGVRSLAGALGYSRCDDDRNKNVLLKGILVEELKKRRFDYKGKTYPLSTNAIDQIVREIASPALHEGLMTANEKIYNTLTLGVTVTEFIDGKKHSPTIPIIDWDNPENNSFLVTEELEVLSSDGAHTRRPDVVGYVNGIPVVVMEAKRPESGNPNKSMVDEGISQNIRNQKQDEIPLLFAYSQLLFAFSNTDGRYGTTKTPRKFWSKWREEVLPKERFQKIKNTALAPKIINEIFAHRPTRIRQHFETLWASEQLPTDQDRMLISLLSRDRCLEFIRFFILFDKKIGKVAARYQQAFGIKALIERINKRKPGGGRESGVIWHTTGSGKSITMVFLCKALLLHESLKNCRVIVVTDRVDLEKQLARTFSTGGAFGSEIAVKKEGERAKVSSGKDLARRIGKGTERIIFSIINKFNTASRQPECYNPSDNLIVLVDEGHRSQGGENHERMKKALPNAAYVAFTGTPLLKNDKTTNKFGPIVHAYTMQRAVEDGTVTPLLYEERQPVLDINEKAIDNWFDKITVGLTDKQKSDLKEKYGKRGPVYGSANRIDLIAWDIAVHFKENFKDLDKGLKGQIATDSKLSAVRYKKALDATGLVTSAVVISPPDTREGHEDVDESELPEVQQWWKDNVKGDPETYERNIIDAFSTDVSPDILIVVDKLLTGFDEPRNAVLYIDKALKQHNLTCPPEISPSKM